MELLNTIQHTDALTLMSHIETDTIDMTITSPPYDNLRTYTDGHTFDFENIAKELYRVLKSGGVLVWVVGDAIINGSETLTSMRQALYFVDMVGFKMHDTMIYHKPGTRFPDPTRYAQQWEFMFVLSKGKPTTVNLLKQPNKWAGEIRGKNAVRTQREPDGSVGIRYRHKIKDLGVLGNVWSIDAGFMKSTKDVVAYQHPATFPEKLVEPHIRTWSNPGDVVFDPFMGSGTTAKMARNNGRNYIGCDISEEYVLLARDRLALPYTMPMFDKPVEEPQPVQADMFATIPV